MKRCPAPTPAAGAALTRRSFSTALLSAFGTLALPGCGGGGGGDAAAASAPAAPVPAPPPVVSSPPPAPATAYTAYSAAALAATAATSIKLTATGAGTHPYQCTLLPLPGQVPAGSTVTSPDDASLAASVLATWPDGSASLVVAAGTLALAANEQRSLRVRAGAAGSAPALDARAITAQVSSVSVDFGSPYGAATLSSLATPERIWWANAQVVVARYRVAAPTPSGTALEAVIDVTAWANRARVEVVVENCRMNTASPARPGAATYAAATVSVNGGAPVATVASSGGPENGHASFRAWYASAWVGGDPGLTATQDVASLQSHPLLFKCDQAPSFDMGAYAGDAFRPWGTGRQRASGMGGGGDHESIGALPRWETHFLQSGDPRAARAVEASALAVLGYNVNYRDATTGLVPTIAELAGKSQQSNWPYQNNGTEAMTWEVAHHPAAGLMAFVCRPSPVFIELAQKVAVFNATLTTFEDVGGSSSNPTGVFGQYYQMRGRAWGVRSLAHATFLTPTTLPWRAAGVESLAANAAYLNRWRTDAKAKLNSFWDGTAAGSLSDSESGAAGFQNKMWQHHYLVTELHKAAGAQLLAGSAQTSLETIADWAALQAVRWVNEQTNGGWRYVPYHTTIGRSATTIDSLDTWGAQMAWSMTDTPSGTTGPWKTDYTGNTLTTYASFGTTDTGGAGYPAYFWAALVVAVERGLPGSKDAWQTVLAGITNLSSWRAAFGSDARWGSAPRNV